MPIVELVEKKFFAIRSCDDLEFGEVLYDQLHALLEAVGDKSEVVQSERIDLQAFSYNESSQGSTKYAVSDEVLMVIRKHFIHNFKDKVEAYGKRKRKLGTELLFELNAGNISIKEFNDRLK